MHQQHLRIWLLAILSIFYLTPVRAALPEIQLQIGMRLVQAEVANTSEARMKGLMGRKQLDDNQGMLFVFERPEIQSMWMRNTPLPLAVAFIDERGVILNISEMVPFDDTPHSSVGIAKYALEMNGGWFSQHGVKAGDKVKRLPK
ncbi:MAG TPA: DUF192 domain-containing protein [Burkholderiales bacterium]|nr:DUF192 domain-containing protein [Burkholderiales bacterium]